MKKRIGLTGGTGFIGQYLIRDHGDEFDFVVATSRDDCTGFSPKAEYRKTTYDLDGFIDAFGGCDAVVHLGAAVPKNVNEVGSMADYYSNVLCSEMLFLAAGKIGIEQIINISSVSVYQKSGPMPLRESLPIEPDNSYGLSKAMVELMSQLYRKKFGYSVTTLRVSQVLGCKKNMARGFYWMLLTNALRNKEITICGRGAAARDYIYVRDVAGAIACALTNPDHSGVYNIGSGKATSNLELAEAYIAGMNSSSPIVHIETEHEDSRYWYMDTSKAEEALGFTPAYDPVSMARDMKREMESANGEL